mgnify:CR=1 FL=1
MSVNANEKKEPELRINVKESWDVNFWCDELNFRADDLKEIVRQVGPNVHDVRLHLTKNLILKWTEAY